MAQDHIQKAENALIQAIRLQPDLAPTWTSSCRARWLWTAYPISAAHSSYLISPGIIFLCSQKKRPEGLTPSDRFFSVELLRFSLVIYPDYQSFRSQFPLFFLKPVPPYFLIPVLNLETAVGCKNDAYGGIGVHGAIKKFVVTVLVMRHVFIFRGGPRACVDFCDPTAVSRLKQLRLQWISARLCLSLPVRLWPSYWLVQWRLSPFRAFPQTRHCIRSSQIHPLTPRSSTWSYDTSLEL